MELSILEKITLKLLPAESKIREFIVLGVKDRIHRTQDLIHELEGDLALDPCGAYSGIADQLLEAQEQLDALHKLMLKLNRL